MAIPNPGRCTSLTYSHAEETPNYSELLLQRLAALAGFCLEEEDHDAAARHACGHVQGRPAGDVGAVQRRSVPQQLQDHAARARTAGHLSIFPSATCNEYE